MPAKHVRRALPRWFTLVVAAALLGGCVDGPAPPEPSADGTGSRATTPIASSATAERAAVTPDAELRAPATPLVDPGSIDDLRAAVGLGTLDEDHDELAMMCAQEAADGQEAPLG